MLRCPNCGSLKLDPSNDGYEDFYTCGICSRQFDKDLNPLRKTIERFNWDMMLTNNNRKSKIEV